MSKQLTLSECRTDTGDKAFSRRTGRFGPTSKSKTLQETRQENNIFVDNPVSSSTTIIINDRCNLGSSREPEDDNDSDSDSSEDYAKEKDVGDARLEASHSNETDDAPTDIAAGPDEAPVQPKIKFPATLKGNKHRSFRADWYKHYNWLEYSRKRNAAYCYPCRFFPTEPGKYWDTFTRIGFNDWKHAMGKNGIIPCHDHCKTHMQAMVSWQEYKRNKESGTSVANRLDAARSYSIKKNRHYLKTILEVLLVCSYQEIALRGHDESKNSSNRGNFIEILKLISSHDEIVKEKLTSGPRNAVYTSPIIQNELLHIMGEMVQDIICYKIREAGLFSILVDESKDISRKEQVTFVLRCIDPKEATTHEYFLTFVEAASLDAESLTQYIVSIITKHQLDLTCIVSQGYDGAAVMSGNCSGVQARLKEFAPYAIYIHCHAHILNLVLVDSVKAVPDATQFFALVESLYVFLSTTKVHVIFLQKQKDLHPHKQTRELQRLCDTRWACRYFSVNSICYTFDAILATLEEVAEDTSDGTKATQAMGLMLQVKSFKFLLCLIIFDKVLSVTKGLSDVLQSISLDLAKAADLVSGTIETLEDFRTDSNWERLFTYIESVAKLHGINIVGHRPSRKRKLPSRLCDAVILESTGSSEAQTTSQEFKVGVYYPVLDAFLLELHERFSGRNVELMKAIHACNPHCSQFLDPEQLQPLAACYNLDSESLNMESRLCKRTLAKRKLKSTSEVFKELLPLKEAFPTLLKVLQIALTICVSSASCERSFSALKRIKTYLRSTMQEERLVNLALLSVEQEISQTVNLEDVIDKFCTADKNRRISLI